MLSFLLRRLIRKSIYLYRHIMGEQTLEDAPAAVSIITKDNILWIDKTIAQWSAFIARALSAGEAQIKIPELSAAVIFDVMVLLEITFWLELARMTELFIMQTIRSMVSEMLTKKSPAQVADFLYAINYLEIPLTTRIESQIIEYIASTLEQDAKVSEANLFEQLKAYGYGVADDEWFARVRDVFLQKRFSLGRYVELYGQPHIINGTLDLSNKALRSLIGIEKILNPEKVICFKLDHNHISYNFWQGQYLEQPFAQFNQLEELFLDHNELMELPSDFFCGLSSLKALYLNHNQLTMLPIDLFDALPSLWFLEVDGNYFPGNESSFIRHYLPKWVDRRGISFNPQRIMDQEIVKEQ